MSQPVNARISLLTSQRSAAVAVLVLLTLLWSAVAWNHQDTERRELDEVRRETTTLALLFAHETDSTFHNVNHALLDLRSAWAHRAGNLDDVALKYKELLAGAVLQLAIIGADGNLAYSSLGMPKETTFLGEREHFKVHTGGLQDQLFVSRPLKGKVSGKWSIQLSRPIFRNAQFVGVAVISVDPNYFVRFYQNAGMGEDGLASMIRGTGDVMARSNGQDKYVGTVIDSSLYSSASAPLQGSFRRKSPTDGVERLSSYYRLPQYGLTVVVGPSVDERLAPLRSQQRQIVFAAGLVSGLLLLATWLLMRALARNAAAHRALITAEASARDSSQRLAEVIWGTEVGTWEWHVPSGACVFNERCAEMVGYTLAELAPVSIDTWQRLVHPEDGKRSGELLARCFGCEQGAYDCELRMHHKDGHWVWVHARGRVVEWAAAGQPLRMAGTYHDISARKQVQAELVEFHRNFEAFLNQTSDFVYFKDHDNRFRFCSQALATLTGHADWHAMIGKHELEVFPPDTGKIYYEEEFPIFATGKPLLNKINPFYYADGKSGFVETNKWPLVDEDGRIVGLFGISRDITERKRTEDQIHHMAQHDALTGLANRALFADRLQCAMANALRDKAMLALLFIDLDKFKPVNDQFGHEAGDQLLKMVAQRMLACVRDSDTVARVGGDEFVVLLRDVAGTPEALAVAEKIRASMEMPFTLAEHSVHIASCVGVALYPKHGADDQTLSKNADHAMYQAKERGRNLVVLFEAGP